jgi:hypothetical protein
MYYNKIIITTINIMKIEKSYEEIKKEIKPLDLVFFGSHSLFPILIRFIESIILKNNGSDSELKAGDFSHVGIIITTDIIKYPHMEDGKLYIFESTASGNNLKGISDGIENINGDSYFGVQIRDLEAIINADKKTNIAFGHLQNNPIDDITINDLKKNFTNIVNKYIGQKYDYNLIGLSSSLIPCIRFLRNITDKILDTELNLFCSELVSHIYKDLNIFPQTVKPFNVVPMDFLNFDIDSIENGGIPCVIDRNLLYIKR